MHLASCDRQQCTRRVGFSNFSVEVLSVLDVSSLGHEKKRTWIIPHEAVEVFGWTFLDGFETVSP